MTSGQPIVRAGALAAIVGGLLLIAGDLPLLLWGPVEAQAADSPIPFLHSLLCMLGTPLLVLALPGLYLRQAERAGRLGVVAFFVALLGTTLMVSSDWFELFAGPPLEALVPGIADQPPTAIIAGFVINFVTESLGWLLFGIATYRARVFPRATALVLIVGVLLVPVGPVWITMVWNGAIVGMGIDVLRAQHGVERSLSLETA